MDFLHINKYFAIILLFFSCQRSDDGIKETNKVNIVVSEHPDAKHVELDDLFQKVQYIQLETTNDNYINEISDITIANNKIYIIDQQTLQILAFTIHGKYLFKISKTGRGPGEFLNIEDIFVNDSGIFIMDRARRKIIRYSLGGRYINEIGVKFPFFEFVMKDNQIFTNSRNYATNSFDKTLHVLDTSGNIEKSIIPNYSGLENRPWSLYQNFYSSDENIFFIPDFSTTVYQIINNNFTPTYEIIIGKKWFDENNWKFDGNSYNFMNYVNSEEAIFGIRGFSVNNSYVYFGYDMGASGFFNFYNKSNDRMISFKVNSYSNSKIITNRIMPWKMCDGVGVYIISSGLYLEKLSRINNSINDVSVYDNPIIVLSYFKNYEDLDIVYQ